MSFNGPLFIVGLPRSGTKLIRDLLNQSSEIGIPSSETNFIPAITRSFNFQPPKDETELEMFYDRFAKVNFFHRMKKAGLHLTKDEFMNNVGIGNWESIFSFILRYYSTADKMSTKIYGDKSPPYLRYLDVLNTLFPNAKFLHIIRDPRDYCVSIRHIWRKNIFRAADNWQREIAQARKITQGWENYKEITYEQLIKRPELTLTEICNYLGCSFSEQMLLLSRPSENYGDAKDNSSILQTNSGKYNNRLTKNEIKKIEEIVYPVMKTMDYPIHYANKEVSLTRVSSTWYRLKDIYFLILFHVKEKGFINGLTFLNRGLKFRA